MFISLFSCGMQAMNIIQGFDFSDGFQRAYSKEIFEKHAKNDSYIIALILEEKKAESSEAASCIYSYDAHLLNHMLFGKYPFKNLYPNSLSTYKNPGSDLSIEKLEYYECEPGEKVFKFMCSYADLCSNNEKLKDFWHNRFYANQDFDLIVAARGKNNIGASYLEGDGVEQDYARALRAYRWVARQEYDLKVKALANINLGDMYLGGFGVRQSYKKAKRFFMKAAKQNDDLESKAAANLRLGDVYMDEKNLDYDVARSFFQEAADQNDNLDVKAAAAAKLLKVVRENLG